MDTTMTVGFYLGDRLRAFNVSHIFGVPGDYVLGLMDELINSPVELVCTCNELNAGYAADAYGRVRGMGAVCVTYGVGAFSLINAVVGAYAERVPLVVISGAPSRANRRSHLMLHHTTGDLNLQYKILEKATVMAVVINDVNQAAQQIDQALAACAHYRRPVYIEIPTDIAQQPCPVSAAPPAFAETLTDVDACAEAVQEAIALLSQAKSPVILAGVEFHRFDLEDKLLKLLEITGFPIATTLLGKSCIAETHSQFIGTYVGALSRQAVHETVEKADCVLCLGAIMSDMNLGVYTAKLEEQRLINANSEKVKIKHHYYQPVYLGDFLDELCQQWHNSPRQNLDIIPAASLLSEPLAPTAEQKLTNAYFYKRLNHFLTEMTDPQLVISDTGDAIVATMDLIMPQAAEFIGQAFYLSIGYSIPACLGASLAATDRRAIAIVGDGAFQMTAQELSTIIRHRLHPIIFLINNDGYTIERVIQDNVYNDLQPWKYHQLPQVFGDCWSCEVRTETELETALEKACHHLSSPIFIEVHLDRFDCSQGLKRLGAALKSMNSH
ncbi:alpha-keto acid decarboxylase family protein [Synechocystis sp. PCC 6714]|uniref:alpha-keto acid decarboxylase family protein n=1 Tax=Synechocystis sp. (strain PCC 6714) TaxID=1147 RepID=UPI0004917EE9|nr:thiamine pyrophosphate-binding protein [Synechocystis sp. PCC 6714]